MNFQAWKMILSQKWHNDIDAHVARAHAERKLLVALALKQIKRKAEFPERSAGQKLRREKEARCG